MQVADIFTKGQFSSQQYLFLLFMCNIARTTRTYDIRMDSFTQAPEGPPTAVPTLGLQKQFTAQAAVAIALVTADKKQVEMPKDFATRDGLNRPTASPPLDGRAASSKPSPPPLKSPPVGATNRSSPPFGATKPRGILKDPPHKAFPKQQGPRPAQRSSSRTK